jgi:hypothetical protein
VQPHVRAHICTPFPIPFPYLPATLAAVVHQRSSMVCPFVLPCTYVVSL